MHEKGWFEYLHLANTNDHSPQQLNVRIPLTRYNNYKKYTLEINYNALYINQSLGTYSKTVGMNRVDKYNTNLRMIVCKIISWLVQIVFVSIPSY